LAITRYHVPVFRHRDGALVAPLAVGFLILAGCSTNDGDRAKKPAETPVAEARAAAAGKEPEAEPPRESNARTLDAYKRDAARRIYFKNPSLLYDGAPPPVLKSIVVLSIRIDATGKPTRVTLVRSNGFRELEQRAMKSVEVAGPLPIPRASLLKVGAMEYYETWLFRDDERFQIRSLAEAQQSPPDAKAD
jgi:periplasmic protein TonB